MGVLGMGTAGMMYLMYKGSTMRNEAMRQQLMIPQKHLFDPIVQDRIRKTLMYFGSGLAATGAITAFMRNSMFLHNHPFMFLFASFGLMFGTLLTDYQR